MEQNNTRKLNSTNITDILRDNQNHMQTQIQPSSHLEEGNVNIIYDDEIIELQNKILQRQQQQHQMMQQQPNMLQHQLQQQQPPPQYSQPPLQQPYLQQPYLQQPPLQQPYLQQPPPLQQTNELINQSTKPLDEEDDDEKSKKNILMNELKIPIILFILYIAISSTQFINIIKIYLPKFGVDADGQQLFLGILFRAMLFIVIYACINKFLLTPGK